MNSQQLVVTWTMDCETVQEESPATGGPATWDLAERSMRGYVESLAARGHKVTLFLIPRLAEGLPEAVRELGAAGADLGMHLHPQTTDLGYDRHLGQLPVETQRVLLEQCRDRVAAVTGQPPTSFRPGCFSGTWETFPILMDLGFTQGSVTLPGRNNPAVGAVWGNETPFAHWRQGRAGQRFLEMPTAAALEQIGPHREAPCDPDHLRLERDRIADWGPDLIQEYVRYQVERDWWLKSVVVMTHDTRYYDDPSDPYRRNLERIADALESTAAEFGLELAPATLAEVRALKDQAADN
jgi:peptidoglycan/xylan/chitin deacetylase (PgdA/CDA1 family)